jgi:hypothetical protein
MRVLRPHRPLVSAQYFDVSCLRNTPVTVDQSDCKDFRKTIIQYIVDSPLKPYVPTVRTLIIVYFADHSSKAAVKMITRIRVHMAGWVQFNESKYSINCTVFPKLHYNKL